MAYEALDAPYVVLRFFGGIYLMKFGFALSPPAGDSTPTLYLPIMPGR
jgi:hypothetical protein